MTVTGCLGAEQMFLFRSVMSTNMRHIAHSARHTWYINSPKGSWVLTYSRHSFCPIIPNLWLDQPTTAASETWCVWTGRVELSCSCSHCPCCRVSGHHTCSSGAACEHCWQGSARAMTSVLSICPETLCGGVLPSDSADTTACLAVLFLPT